MSDFQDQPKFYLAERQNLDKRSGKYPDSNLIGQSSGVFKSLILKELIRQVKSQFDDGAGFRNKRYKLKSQKRKYRRKL